MKRLLTISLISTIYLSAFAQKSLEDLEFLVGNWQITHIYNPNTDTQRIQKGTMVCQRVLDNKYIRCSYTMSREGREDALMDVYFNYNSIYDLYESLWLSSTWPVKVLEKGLLDKTGDRITLQGSAEFLIENDLTEYVNDELVMTTDAQFERNTKIRTSTSSEWHHHMTEIAKRIN